MNLGNSLSQTEMQLQNPQSLEYFWKIIDTDANESYIEFQQQHLKHIEGDLSVS